ncbi:Biotin biosynthesis cytochrome P450 [Geodia barretti]|uniref:Biotin biosynthesis cytochrome P450 n=1 Tax=Geodia barretti TaxID=519541 RepID=A0AA35QS93_GEOBA|nr:Biotin biosynthesis cytochrome P450 [Geodia barretti]
MPSTFHDDLFAPDAIRDPYTFFGTLRDAQPVRWNQQYQVWIISSYKQLVWTARHPEYFSSEVALRDTQPLSPTIPEEDMELFGAVRQWLAARFTQNDGAKHKEQRKVVHGFFTPKAMESWRPLVRQTVSALLDDLQGSGQLDMMRDFATPLTYSIIAGLMDIPESDRAFVKELSSQNAVTDYLKPIVAERVREPGDDLLSVICRGEIMGAYTRDEVLANALLLLVAGHETTNDLIANGILAFSQHPDQFKMLRSDPDGHIVDAVEEILRYDSPLKSVQRIATQNIEMEGGQRVGKDDRVRWVISSANRDPSIFDNPDDLDISRNPNPHVAFGSGVHHCLGATLARLEGQEAFAALAQRFEGLQLETDPADLEYLPSVGQRTLLNLPITTR